MKRVRRNIQGIGSNLIPVQSSIPTPRFQHLPLQKALKRVEGINIDVANVARGAVTRRYMRRLIDELQNK